MNHALRRISFFIGLGILIISMYWSQDGFNFDIAGTSGYKTLAVLIGWFLAITVTVVEFIFSSNFKDLNPSLILFGIMAYVYSIYTNYEGILHFQGTSQNWQGALVLGIFMDALAEPMIAWSLYESRGGDFIGNIINSVRAIGKGLASAPDSFRERNQNQNDRKSGFQEKSREKPRIRPEFQKRLERVGNSSGNSQSFENLHRVNSNNSGNSGKPNRFEVNE